MNKIAGAAAAALVFAAVGVQAIDQVPARESSSTGAEVRDQPEQYERQPSGMPKVPGAEPIQPKAVQPGQGQRAAATDPDTASEDRRWVQEIRGKVMTVDHKSGVVSVAPETGDPIVLQFTPESVAAVATGEQIVTRSSYSRDQYAPGAKDMLPTAKPDLQGQAGRRLVSGTVADVDKSTGRIDLKTESTTLKLQFPPQVVESLQDGDRILVDMGFTKVDQPPARG